MGVDQEASEAAITTAAALLSAPSFTPSSDKLMQRLLAKISHESTVLPIVRAFQSLPRTLNLAPISEPLFSKLSSLLQTGIHNRTLRENVLTCLASLLANESFSSSSLQEVFRDTGPLLAEGDSLTVVATVRVILACFHRLPSSTAFSLARGSLYAPSLKLLVSPQLQDLARDALLDLFHAFVEALVVSFEEVIRDLEALLPTSTASSVARQSQGNVTKAIAASCVTPEQRKTVAIKCIQNMNARDRRQSALITLGELGPFVDLSVEASALKENLLACFELANEDDWATASFALVRTILYNFERIQNAVSTCRVASLLEILFFFQ